MIVVVFSLGAYGLEKRVCAYTCSINATRTQKLGHVQISIIV
jgi:hypothetical protein